MTNCKIKRVYVPVKNNNFWSGVKGFNLMKLIRCIQANKPMDTPIVFRS